MITLVDDDGNDAMASMHMGFGELDLDYLDEDQEPETIRTPGSATLVIEDKCDALFFSAEWSIIAKVGNKTLAMSAPASCSHSASTIRRWSREMIRRNVVQLRRLGVDVDATYQKLGGSLNDIA